MGAWADIIRFRGPFSRTIPSLSRQPLETVPLFWFSGAVMSICSPGSSWYFSSVNFSAQLRRSSR